jgi:hypothetical protein
VLVPRRIGQGVPSNTSVAKPCVGPDNREVIGNSIQRPRQPLDGGTGFVALCDGLLKVGHSINSLPILFAYPMNLLPIRLGGRAVFDLPHHGMGANRMIVINRNGLSESEFQKVLQPYAKNSGQPVDFERAGKAAVEFLADNPTLLADAGKLLDTAQK